MSAGEIIGREGLRPVSANAIPQLQGDLSLSSTEVQWIIDGYLLALSALFASGGKLADVAGHRRMS